MQEILSSPQRAINYSNSIVECKLVKEKKDVYIEAKILYTFDFHRSQVRCSLNFPKPINQIVTAGDDKIIAFWDSSKFSKNQKPLEVIKEQKSFMNQLLKWDDHSFLSVADDASVFHISVYPKIKILKKMRLEDVCYQLVQLDDTQFLSFSSHGLMIYSIITGKKIRQLQTSTPSVTLIMKNVKISNIDKFCVYLNPDGDNSLILVNYDEDKLVKKFDEHGNKSIFTFDLLLKSKFEEIIFVGGSVGYIFVYKSDFRDTKVVNEKRLISTIYTGVTLYCCRNVLDKYLFLGDGYGILHVFDISKIFSCEDEEQKENISKTPKILAKKIHYVAGTESIYSMEIFKIKESKITIISTGHDHKVKITEIRGLNFSLAFSQEIEDLMDRVNYFKESVDEYFPNDGNNVFRIELLNLQIQKIFKSLVLM